MYKFCTLAEVEEDEKTKLAILPCSKQHIIGKPRNISNKLLQNPPIYENVILNVVGQVSNEFQVIPKDTHKHSDAMYEDIRYKRAMIPRFKPDVPPRPRQELNTVGTPQMDKKASFTTSSQTDTVVREDVVREISQTLTACESLKRNKPLLQPKPRLNTLKQHKVSLTVKKETDIPLITTTTTTPYHGYVPMTSIDDEKKGLRKSTSMSFSNEESKLRKSSSVGYLSMVSSDKGSYEITDPNDVISASETDEYDARDHEYCQVKDVEFGTSQENYSQIDEAKIQKCIYSIENSDLKSKSNISEDELSDMLYKPVDESISVDHSKSLGIGYSGGKYYDFDVAEEMVRGAQHIPVLEKKHVTRTVTKPVTGKQFQSSTKTESQNTSVFVDFSDDSLLAKLGEKMRKDLEKKKYAS